LVIFAEMARPDASKTPKAGKGRHLGDRPDKVTGGENGELFSSRRERNPGGRKTQGRIGSEPLVNASGLWQRTSGGINTGQPGKDRGATDDPLRTPRATADEAGADGKPVEAL
jgi:hypothetical protein